MGVPAHLTLTVGETVEIRLRGHAMAGIMWEYVTTGPSDVVNVSLGAAGPEPQREEAAALPLGHSRDQQITVRALRAGHVTIDLRLRQPWDAITPPLEQHRIEVDITS